MFTVQQIQEIARKLETMSKKDSQFQIANALTGTEYFPILQDKKNKRVLLSELTEYMKDTIVLDNSTELQFLKETLVNELNTINSKLDEIKENLSNITTGNTTEKVKLTVTTNVANSVVTLNGAASTSIEVPFSTLVVIKVAAEGYSTYNEIIPVFKTQTIKVNLDKVTTTVIPDNPDVEYCTLSVVPDPSGATVKLNGQLTKVITVKKGTEVSVEISATNHDTYNKTIVVNSNQELKVKLSYSAVVFEIQPIPEDAKVSIQFAERKKYLAFVDTDTHWKVEKEGYITQSGIEKLYKNTVKQVTLEAIPVGKVNFSINATPSDSTIVINGNNVNTVNVDEGSTVSWSVARTGYNTQEGAEVVNQDTVKNIELIKKQYTLTVNPTPSDAVVKIDNVVRNSITVDYNTSVHIEVSKEGYISQGETIILTEDTVKQVILEPISQDTEYISISPQELEFNNNIQTKEISINSNSNWEFDMAKPSWITLDKSSGINNDTVQITASQHTGRNNRTGSLICRTSDGTESTVQITQYGKPEFIDIDTEITEIGSEATSIVFTGTSNVGNLKLYLSDNFPYTGGLLRHNNSIIPWNGITDINTHLGANEEYTFILKIHVGKNPNTSSQDITVSFGNENESLTNNFTISQEGSEEAPVITYGDVQITGFEYNKVPASGGTATVKKLLFKQTYGYNGETTGGGEINSEMSDIGVVVSYSGNVAGNNINSSNGDVTVPSKGTVISEETSVGQCEVTVQLNGKTATATTNIYQEENTRHLELVIGNSDQTLESSAGVYTIQPDVNEEYIYSSGAHSQLDLQAPITKCEISVVTPCEGFSTDAENTEMFPGDTFDIEVTKNTTAENRGPFVIQLHAYSIQNTSYDVTKNITFVQQGNISQSPQDYVNVSPTELNFNYAGEVKTITINSDNFWVIE